MISFAVKGCTTELVTSRQTARLLEICNDCNKQCIINYVLVGATGDY